MYCSNCGQELGEDKTFCTSCGAPAPKDDPAPPAGQSAIQAAVPEPASYGGGIPPQGGQPGGAASPKRTGVIVGSALAIVVVLAGAGVGLWLGLRGGDGESTGTTAAVVDGSATTVTVPGLNGGTETTAPADAGLAAYRTAVENMLRELDFDHGRIPELADIINAETPDVPQGVYDDLELMLGRTQDAYDALRVVDVPAAFEEANHHLENAAAHMIARIQATMDGVQAGWDSDSTNAAKPYYSTGRQQRDAYLADIHDFFELVPQGTLPGD